MFKMGRIQFLLSVFLLFSSALMAVQVYETDLTTKVPAEINYQGYITDSAGVPINGVKDIYILIYDSLTGGNMMTGTNPRTVNISNGYFNYVFGSTSLIEGGMFKDYYTSIGNSSIRYNVDFRKKYYIEIRFADVGSTTWETLSPRQEMTSVPYAMAARKVVYTQVLTVAYDGGDEGSVSRAVDRILGQGPYSTAGPLTPAPSINTPWVIKVQGGRFNEAGTTGGSGMVILPDYVSVAGDSSRGSVLDTGNGIKLGKGSSLENIKILGATNRNVIIASNITDVRVQNCVIEGQTINFGIDFSGSVNCVAQGNQIIGYGSGAAKGINLAGSSYCYVKDNLIDIAYSVLPASTSGSRGITDSGTPFIDCYITGNTIRYVTTGAAGTTASVGIFLTAGGIGSVANNVFHKGAPAKDIVNGATGALPVWGAAGPRGNFNMRSDGTAMPSF